MREGSSEDWGLDSGRDESLEHGSGHSLTGKEFHPVCLEIGGLGTHGGYIGDIVWEVH